MGPLSWVTDGFEKPKRRFSRAEGIQKPEVKAEPLINMFPPMRGIRTDEEFQEALAKHEKEGQPVCVMFGSSWCHRCHQIFPQFLAARKSAPDVRFFVAVVDRMRETTRDVRWTPSFAVYRGGKRVDFFSGERAQRVADRIWLHSDASADLP